MTAARFECPRCQTVFVKDIAGDAAFVECPSCGALALPAGDATDGALQAALSTSQPQATVARGGPAPLASTEGESPPMPSDPSAPAPGMFSDLLSSSTSNPSGAPVVGSAKAPELDFDFGGDIELPAFPAPPTTNAARSSDGPPVHALAPEAMAQLAADADAGPTNSTKQAPWSGLSEDAFGDLEKAFDEMALKPAPPPLMRGSLTTDEERFLRNDSEVSGPASRPPPLRRVDGERTERNQARPPPRSATKNKERRPRPTHFELSAEAKNLAFLPLKTEDSLPQQRPRMERQERQERQPEQPRPVTAVTAEETDVVRGTKQPPKKPVPSALGGLTFLRAVALVLGCTILGGVGGALTAPKPKVASTARSRAELQFANGNKFYDAGRYDDALGAFRGALSIDPTFALAHRAKGAALAKLSRFDEAAEAYDEYLKLDKNAVDSPDVQNAITRRRGEK